MPEIVLELEDGEQEVVGFNAEQWATLCRAAELTGRSIEDLLLTGAKRYAESIIAAHGAEQIRVLKLDHLDPADPEAIIAALKSHTLDLTGDT